MESIDKVRFSVGDTTIVLISKFQSTDTSMPYVALGDYHS